MKRILLTICLIVVLLTIAGCASQEMKATDQMINGRTLLSTI